MSDIIKDSIVMIEVYTARNVMSFEVVRTVDRMTEAIAETLEEDGSVILDLIDGARLVLNAMNVVAIKIVEIPPGE